MRITKKFLKKKYYKQENTLRENIGAPNIKKDKTKKKTQRQVITITETKITCGLHAAQYKRGLSKQKIKQRILIS